MGKELIFVLVWIERLGRVGEDDLFGFGLQPDEVTGEILLDPFGRATLHKKNSAMTESQTLVVVNRLDEWIRELGYCQLSCISTPQYLQEEEAKSKKWRPRELDLWPLNLPNYKRRHMPVAEEEWGTALDLG